MAVLCGSPCALDWHASQGSLALIIFLWLFLCVVRAPRHFDPSRLIGNPGAHADQGAHVIGNGLSCSNSALMGLTD